MVRVCCGKGYREHSIGKQANVGEADHYKGCLLISLKARLDLNPRQWFKIRGLLVYEKTFFLAVSVYYIKTCFQFGGGGLEGFQSGRNCHGPPCHKYLHKFANKMA